MRKFSSYGPLDNKLEYYAPREALIAHALTQVRGEDPDADGHYITVWAPRQTGKTWVMREVYLALKQDSRFDTAILSLQYLTDVTEVDNIVRSIARQLADSLSLELPAVDVLEDFHTLFSRKTLQKPLILVLDEFDTLPEAAISKLVAVFRHIYTTRRNQTDKATTDKDYLLHGLALIGVRSVLGIENLRGSPFNVQRSLHIPNLTYDEVKYLFDWYQRESGQAIEAEVIERIWYEFQGQPGLTCWFGEQLTETYNKTPERPLSLAQFEEIYTAAYKLLPNNNILNIISKAKQEPYKALVLKLFQTDQKTSFSYDDPIINFLYMNGVVAVEEHSPGEKYVQFPSPYIQKRLFGYFARELYAEPSRLYGPFEDISDTVTETTLNLRRLLQRYEQYLQTNREMVLKDAPRRKDDLRVFEAVFHFHLYQYLNSFLYSYDARVQAEFPTGNGQIDLLIRHAGQLFGLELKSFTDQRAYRKGLEQAAKYARQLDMAEIWLAMFVEAVDDTNRARFEADYSDAESGVCVHPVFVQTGALSEL